MRFMKIVAVLFALILVSRMARADASSLSLAGTLAGSTSVFGLTFTVDGSGNQTVTFQIWGFGGGTNAAGTPIPAGGFDPFLGLFVGAGPGATIFTDNTNPAGTSDTLTNFTTGFGIPGGPGISTFVGCGPAGTVAFGNGDAVCGDITMTLTLTPGTYTVVLSDANYQASAVFDNGTLDEGFTDLTGGVFQTCDTNVTTNVTSCITPSDAWAFDITDANGANLGTAIPTPEPGELSQLALGLLALAAFGFFHRERLYQQREKREFGRE